MNEPEAKRKGLMGRFFGGGAEQVAAPAPANDKPVVENPAPPGKTGWLSRLRAGLGKTSAKLSAGKPSERAKTAGLFPFSRENFA